MRIFLGLSALFAVMIAAPAFAQGTPQQREACESDAHRLCDDQIPDAIAVEKCLRANIGKLSAPCRAEFGGGGKRRK